MEGKFYDMLGATLWLQTFVSVGLWVHVCECVWVGGEGGVFEYYSPHKNLNTQDRLHFVDTGEQIIHLLQIEELSKTIEASVLLTLET